MFLVGLGMMISGGIMNKRKTITAVIVCVIVFVLLINIISNALFGPKKARKMIRQAKRDHGACYVVSKTKTDDGIKVVLHDELQDFDYTVYSFKMDMNLDGASFGHVTESRDLFYADLIDHVINEVKPDLDRIASKEGIRYETYDEGRITTLMPAIYACDPDSGRQAALAFAEIIQEHNLNGRMDGWEMIVYKESDSARKRDLGIAKELGRVKFPDKTYVEK